MNHSLSGKAFKKIVALLVTIASWHGTLAADEATPNSVKSATDSLGDALPQGALLRLGTQRFRHPSSVVELALSPDEKTVLTIGNELIAWDVATGQMRWRIGVRELGINLPGAAYGVRPLAFASNSSRFYTPGRHNQVLVWDVASGKHEVLSLSGTRANEAKDQPPNVGHDGDGAPPKAIDVTSDGRKLALGSSQGVFVCDEKGKVLFTIANKPDAPVAINDDRLMFGGHYSFGRFSPDQKLLAVVTSDSPQEIQLSDVETGKELRRLKLKSRLVRFAFSPDSRRIVTTERDIAARLYSADTGETIWSYEIKPTNNAESYLSAITYCPDSSLIAVGAPIGSDNEIRLLDAATGKEVGKLVGHAWKPWTLAAGRNQLYSSGWDGTVRRWDVDNRKQLPLPVGIRATAVVAASPDGRKLAYGDDSGTIHLVLANDGTELHTLELVGTDFSQLTFSPDSQQLAGGGAVGDHVRVAVWDLSNGNVVRDWKWPKGRDPHSHVESLCFRPDGQQLAAAVFRQSAAYLWDLTTGDQVAQLEHTRVYGLSFSPDGITLATAGWDQIVRFWETSGGELQRQLNVAEVPVQGNDHRMYTVCYAPTGGIFATAHLDGKVRIWNAADLELRKEFEVNGRFIFGSISFSPDGSLLATGSAGGKIVLWDPMTAEAVWEVGQHESYVYTVAFGADNRTLVSGGNDGVCYQWDLQPRGQPPEQDLNVSWKDFAGSGTAAYRAMWAMTQTPDRTVTFLGSKLRPVTKVMDLDRIVKGLSAEEASRRQRLIRILVGKDERVALSSVVRRAVTLLSQLGTADAKRLLQELAEGDPEGELGRLAAAAAERSNRVEGRK